MHKQEMNRTYQINDHQSARSIMISSFSNEILLAIIVAAGAPVHLRYVSKRFHMLFENNKNHIEKEIVRLLARQGNVYHRVHDKIDGPGPRTVTLMNSTSQHSDETAKLYVEEQGSSTWHRATIICPTDTFCPFDNEGILTELWVENMASCEPESVHVVVVSAETLLNLDCTLLPLIDEPMQLFKERLGIPVSRSLTSLRIFGGSGELRMRYRVLRDFDRTSTPLYTMISVPYIELVGSRMQSTSWHLEGDHIENIYVSLRPKLVASTSKFVIEVDWKTCLTINALEIKQMLMPPWKAIRMLEEIKGHNWCQEVDTDRVLVIPIGQKLHGYSNMCTLSFTGSIKAIDHIFCDSKNELKFHGSLGSWMNLRLQHRRS